MKTICIMISALMLCAAAMSQNVTDELSNHGFENVRLKTVADKVYVIFNDPAYRGTFRGPAEAIKLISSHCLACSKIEMVVEEYGTPKVAVHAAKADGHWSVEADYQTKDIVEILESCGGQTVGGCKNSTYRKIDVTINPIVSLDNHRFDKLFELGTFIAPTIETSLWKGNRINVEPIFPIYTNLDKRARNRQFQLGSTNIQQDIIFGGEWYATATVGTFRPCRMGANIDFGYRPTPQLALGVRTNWTVDSYFDNGTWYVGSADLKGHRSEVSALFKADYFHTASAIQAQLSAGRFVYGDWGARIDMTRHYGDFAIGVFGILTGGEHNAGFHFAIPVRGKRNRQKGTVRVNLPEYYDLQYNMVSSFDYAELKMGTELEVRPIENRSLQYWNAGYIKRNTQRILDGLLE